MTALHATPARDAPASPQNERAKRARRWLFWIPVAVVVLSIVVVIAVIQTVQRASTAPLDPTSASPSGAQALVRVLEQQGVTVRTVTTFAEALEATASPGTLVVHDPGGAVSASRLDSLMDRATHLVLIEPGEDALEGFDAGLREAGVQTGDVAPECVLPLATRAGPITTSGTVYTVEGSPRDLVQCYPAADGGYSLVAFRMSGTEVLVLGAASALSNEYIAENGNAAFALGALGANEQLVWYSPSWADFEDGAPVTMGSLSPQWVIPLTLLGLATFVAAAVWRGRRMGPLVAESLPVVVRSTETMEGRARLYERAGARLRALDALRVGAISRMSSLLGLGRTTPVQDVAVQVAAVLQRDQHDVARILIHAEPGNESEFAQLVTELDRLEKSLADRVRGDQSHT